MRELSLCDMVGIKARDLRGGILVRHYGTPSLRDRLRISVGRPDQNDVLLATLKQIAAEVGR